MIIQWKGQIDSRDYRSDRVTEELLMEVCNMVREAVIKTIPKRKKCEKVKWLSEEVLQIDEKRKERQRRHRKI